MSNRSTKKASIVVAMAAILLVTLIVLLTQPGSTMRKQSNNIQLEPSEKATLKQLQEQGIKYFIDNQLPNGLVLDRQANMGTPTFNGWISTSATGMGFMAIAIASSPDHHMLTHAQAVARIRKGIQTSLKLHSDHGLMPHFLDATTMKPIGQDNISTIDSGWLIAGALLSAEYLDDDGLRALADKLYQRVDWAYWGTQTPDGIQLAMGADATGKKLPVQYDRYDSEAAVLYMLAFGADNGTNIPAENWFKLSLKPGVVAGIQVTNYDLGLFAFQFGGSLIDYNRLPLHGMPDLNREHNKAALANFAACREASKQYKTFERYWGLSAGDGPPDAPGGADVYRVYAPQEIDGTAHITASLASIEQVPELVLGNIKAAEAETQLKAHGRYGYSNINVDKNWVSHDVVGIDIGAAVMALENELYKQRMRTVWHKTAVMQRALRRLKAVK